jgi:hypothetical protein
MSAAPTVEQQPSPRRLPVTKAPKIARVLGLTPRQIYHLAASGTVPGLRKVKGAGLVFDPDNTLGLA